MKTFLEYVAEDIKQKYGENMGRVAIVFPNKRASIFINAALAKDTDKPFWSPAYTTISEFFREQSSLQVADNIKLICELYRVYIDLTQSQETFEHFYGWGQLLLADFDDIDKNMADARMVFSNVEGFHEYDDLNYLSQDQIELLKKFFANFSEDQNTVLKRKFLDLWQRLYDIYTRFNERLAQQGLAYEGQLFRQVASKEDLKLRHDTYIFVGFNMMQKAEIRVAKLLQEMGKAKFYWDYDRYYTSRKRFNGVEIEHEAGHYVNQLRQLFPNELEDSRDEIYDNLGKLTDISIMSAPTEDIQARYVAKWLRENDRWKDGIRTAVVLADENLLPTITYCVPENVVANITMGYPLALSPLTSMIMQLISLQVGKRYRHPYSRKIFVDKILHLPYAQFFDSTLLDQPLKPGTSSDTDPLKLVNFLLEIVNQIGAHCRTEDKAEPLIVQDQFFRECLFRIYSQLSRLRDLIEDGDLPVISGEGLQSLLRQLINEDSVPFHGEPAQGVQLMGVLETRNLDFKHVLLLSCNEGNLPKGISDTSFIPYSIRKAFSLITVDNKVSIYSYYFHSLLQRAEDVTLIYDNATTDGKTGEMSRFLLQLLTEKGTTVKKLALQTPLEIIKQQPPTIKKEGLVKDALNSIDSLTPTALNNFLRCPLRFYYRYILHIKEPVNPEEETIDNVQFGLIFHKAAQLIYDDLSSNAQHLVRKEDITRLRKDNQKMEQFLDEAFKLEYFKDAKPSYNGLQVINRKVIMRLLQKMLEIDADNAPFTILGTEKNISSRLTTATGKQVGIYGIIDRLDCAADKASGRQVIRVIDYKTGRKNDSGLKSIAEIFEPKNIVGKHTDYYLQTILYSKIVWDDKHLNRSGLPVKPILFYVQNAKAGEDDLDLLINKVPVAVDKDFGDEFTDGIQKVINDIFDESQPFTPTPNTDQCDKCPFYNYCY